MSDQPAQPEAAAGPAPEGVQRFDGRTDDLARLASAITEGVDGGGPLGEFLVSLEQRTPMGAPMVIQIAWES